MNAKEIIPAQAGLRMTFGYSDNGRFLFRNLVFLLSRNPYFNPMPMPYFLRGGSRPQHLNVAAKNCLAIKFGPIGPDRILGAQEAPLLTGQQAFESG